MSILYLIKHLRNTIFLIIFSLYLFSCNTIEPPVPITEYESIDESPAWSPDGKWIAYCHFNININDTIYPNGLYLIDTTGENKKLLIAGNFSTPDWAADGKRIVFTNGNIFTIEITTKQIKQLTNNGSDFFPSWSPYGNSISFDRSGSSDTVGTWIINLISLTQNRVGFFSQLDWALTGEEVVFSGKSYNKESESQIWITNINGDNQKELTSNDFLYNRYPKWSSDNNKIAWEVLRNNNSELWIMNRDGNNQKKLTNGSYPFWAPDNKKIVYSKPVNNKIALFIIDIETKVIKQLTY